MNIIMPYGRVFRLLGVALCVGIAAHFATAQGTPQIVMDAITLGQVKGGVPGCGSGIVTDSSFEGGTSDEFWDHFSSSHGNVINNQFSEPENSFRANTGDGWLNFYNEPVVGEYAYAQQDVVLPVAQYAYLLFYVRGSIASVDLTFSIYIDAIELVQLDGNFTEVYEEYVPIALDLTPYADGQAHTLRFEVSMAAGDYTFVHIDDVCIETFGGGEGEGEGAGCLEFCFGEQGEDADGDGLGEICEACAGTDSEKADTDGDGMDDGYEVLYGLQPTNPADAVLEFDGDGLTSVEEYFQGANPFDIDDPYTVRFVAHNGTDTPERGTAGSPWQTIQYAIDRTPASASKPAMITLLPGNYTENVVLKPFVTLRPSSPQSSLVIGSMTGAADCVLDGVHLLGNNSGPILLINDVNMIVQGCRFEPSFGSKGGSSVTGIELVGPGSGASIITGSTFEGCDVAVDVYGDVPTLRSSRISGWNQVGLWIHADGDKAHADKGGIGDETNPDVGFNQFENGVNGPAVRYERSEVFLCENNYWGTTDSDAIANLIEGNADFVPFLNSAAILPASIFCTVVNGSDQSRITNATVTISPSVFAPITDNLGGVYSVNAVSEGRYTLRASAPTFPEATQTIDVDSGELASVVLVLGAGAVEPDPQCGCNGGKAAPNPADALLALSAPLTMLLAAFYMRKS